MKSGANGVEGGRGMRDRRSPESCVLGPESGEKAMEPAASGGGSFRKRPMSKPVTGRGSGVPESLVVGGNALPHQAAELSATAVLVICVFCGSNAKLARALVMGIEERETMTPAEIAEACGLSEAGYTKMWGLWCDRIAAAFELSGVSPGIMVEKDG